VVLTFFSLLLYNLFFYELTLLNMEVAPEWSVGGCSRMVNGRELQYGQWEGTPEWYVFLPSLVAPIVLLLLQTMLTIVCGFNFFLVVIV
jgi:hypothetical protein